MNHLYVLLIVILSSLLISCDKNTNFEPLTKASPTPQSSQLVETEIEDNDEGDRELPLGFIGVPAAIGARVESPSMGMEAANLSLGSFGPFRPSQPLFKGTQWILPTERDFYSLACNKLDSSLRKECNSRNYAELKFLITDFDSTPKVYFQDPSEYEWHHDLAMALNPSVTPSKTEFSSQCASADKTLVCGYLKFVKADPDRDFSGRQVVWSLVEADQIRSEDIIKVHELLRPRLIYDELWDMIGGGGLNYEWYTSWMPLGKRQESIISAQLNDKVKIVFPYQLQKKGEEKILNEGFTVAKLKVLDVESTPLTQLEKTDLVILNGLPLDLPAVAGVITSVDQPRLSHINLLSMNRGTPNVYVQGAESKYATFVDKYVKYRVRKNKVKMMLASEEEFNKFWSVKSPTETITLTPDDLFKDLVQIKEPNQTHDELMSRVGAKAANLANLNRNSKIREFTPQFAFAIPYYFYQQHMVNNNLWAEFDSMTAQPGFDSDAAFREAELKAFRKKIKSAPIDDKLIQKLANKISEFEYTNKKVRFRSSSNAEDLDFFNGAGLYTSKSGYVNPPADDQKKTVANAIRKVWASIWNFQAYEERELFLIDHKAVRMGILVHPSYPSEIEKANGVATSRADEYHFWANINAADGDKSITNPDLSDPRPSGLVSTRISKSNPGTVVIESSDPSNFSPILLTAEIEELTRALELTHRYIYPQSATYLALDYEFKFIGTNRDLLIKQVRPLKETKSLIFIHPDVEKEFKNQATLSRIYSGGDLFKSTCQSDLLWYEEENAGTAGREPYTGYLKIHFKKSVNVGGVHFAAGEEIEVYKNGVSNIYHPFMHHGPYDLAVTNPGQKLWQFGVEPFSLSISINEKDLGISLSTTNSTSPCTHEVLFENWPARIERSMP